MENQNQKIFNEVLLQLLKDIIKNQTDIINLLKLNNSKKKVTFNIK